MSSTDLGPAPESGGPREVLDTERASATPESPTLIGHGTTERFGPGVEGPLEKLEAWFVEVVSHPSNAEAGIEAARELQTELGAERLEHLVTPNKHLSAIERMSLYHYAYHARLTEALEDDFPTVRHALGQERYDRLLHEYLIAHPSDQPTLNVLGAKLPEFCRNVAWMQERAFIHDLARLEWSMIEVFHAEASPILSMSTLQQISPDRWPEVRLPPSATLQLVQLAYPANRYLREVRKNASPAIPEPAASATAVYRKGFGIWRMDLSPPMTRVLDALMQGSTLGDALGGLSENEAGDTDVMGWFKEWVMGGFFRGVEIDGTLL